MYIYIIYIYILRQLERLQGLLPESQGQNRALAIWCHQSALAISPVLLRQVRVNYFEKTLRAFRQTVTRNLFFRQKVTSLKRVSDASSSSFFSLQVLEGP